MHKYSGQLKNYQYDIRVKKSHKGKNSKYYKEDEYFNESIMTFDIETTSAWLEDGKVIGYSKGYSSDYWNELYPLALCYIWQFSVDGKVYYGRELKDFIEVLKDLPDNAKNIIWVHNLAFEFGFLSGILEWDTAFARSPHKPMKCIAKGFPNIEFRCTYMLTRLSLESWGKQLGLPKRVGDLDYDILRTPLTQLTYREQGYCERDCEVVEKGVQYYKNKYKSIHKIPLTQTGIVRREVKDLLMKDEDYRKFIKTLVPRSTAEYKLFQKVFAGGYTHANRLHSGHVIDERVQHYDFASSYPTVMVCEKYPMTPFKKLNKKSIPPSYMFERKAYIMELSFTNIKSTSFNTYLQACKCECTNAYLDNGRVISADTLTTTITEQDFITISNNYVWDDEVQVISLWESNKDYLPKNLLNLFYSYMKTRLR